MTREEIIEALIEGMIELGLESFDEIKTLGTKSPDSVLQVPSE